MVPAQILGGWLVLMPSLRDDARKRQTPPTDQINAHHVLAAENGCCYQGGGFPVRQRYAPCWRQQELGALSSPDPLPFLFLSALVLHQMLLEEIFYLS